MACSPPDGHGDGPGDPQQQGAGDVPATGQLTVTYLRPGSPDTGPLVVTAAVSKQGQDPTICEADAEQDDRAPAHALATFAVLHR